VLWMWRSMKAFLKYIKNMKAYVYYSVFLTVFLALSLYAKPDNWLSFVGCFVAYFMGANIICSYLNDERIDAGWATIEYDNNPLERLFYFVMALVCILLAIIGLMYGWE